MFYPMIDRSGSGEQIGVWLHVGCHMLDIVMGKRMYCDFVPFNIPMTSQCTTYFEKGYWHFHLPGSQGRRVLLHRQLYEDAHCFVLGSAPLTLEQEVHHSHPRSVHWNCLDDLVVMSGALHRQLHARARAKGPNDPGYRPPKKGKGKRKGRRP